MWRADAVRRADIQPTQQWPTTRCFNFDGSHSTDTREAPSVNDAPPPSGTISALSKSQNLAASCANRLDHCVHSTALCRQDNTLWVRLGCAGFLVQRCQHRQMGSEFYRGKFAEGTVCSCHQNATLRQEHNLRLGDELDEEPAWRAPQAASSACDGGDQIVWLLQGPRRFEHFKGFGSEDPRRRVIWLTFRERSNHSGDLFPPYRTTWTTGRNLLLEAALKESNQMKGGCGFLYYVFADGDLTFGRRDIEGFEAFLRRRRPLYGTHAACMYEHSKPRFRAELPGRYLDVTNFDGVLAAFHRNSLASSLLPYEPRFDSSSWFYSQLIVTIQTHVMRNLYNLSFVELCWPPECPRSTMWYLNKDHRTYPRSWEPEVPLRWTLNDNLLGFEALYEFIHAQEVARSAGRRAEGCASSTNPERHS